MQFPAQLDVEVVALEAEDEVTCLVSLAAPVPEEVADRPGETLIAVVDRSGSMSGGPIEAVRTALHQLVDLRRARERPVRVPADLATSAVECAESACSALVPLQSHLESRASTSSRAREALEALDGALPAMRPMSDFLASPQEAASSPPGKLTGSRGVRPSDRPRT